jgi:monoamine oxidase
MKKVHKPKTNLFAKLQLAFRLALQAKASEQGDTLSVLQKHEAYSASRRRFIQNTAIAGLALASNSFISGCRKEDNTALSNGWYNEQKLKVCIVGAGMAGLNCAYQLKKKGLLAKVMEGNSRSGGRMFTAKNIMGNGYTTELGGEFIDSTHKDMLQLVQEFGLTLLDTQDASQLSLTKDAYFFNNQHYTLQQVIAAFQDIAPQMQSHINSLPDYVTYDNPGNGAAFDAMSITQYLESIGCSGFLKKLIEVAYVTEFGLEAQEQSALNLLYLISTNTSQGSFDIFGDSDERYKIAGGNQQLTDALANNIKEQITYEHKLIVIRQVAPERYQLIFEKSNGSTAEVRADVVVLALSFTMLREVDIQIELPEWKRHAIDHLGYGMNAKLMLGFNTRTWVNAGYTGYVFSDELVQSGWDNTQMQNGSGGGYTIYSGGQIGIDVGQGSAASQADNYLPVLNKIFAGSQSAYNGKAERMHWPSSVWMKGSYACYKPGQYSTIAGAERRSIGKLLFAGEHCSLDFQGYMNGAAESGRKAANRILSLAGNRVEEQEVV